MTTLQLATILILAISNVALFTTLLYQRRTIESQRTTIERQRTARNHAPLGVDW